MRLEGSIKIENAKIVSVEKGNVEKDVPNPVCAFTVDTGGALKVKALLKHDLAKTVYHHILQGGTTISEVLPSTKSADLVIRKEVLVTFTGDLREMRATELVLDNLTELSFSFVYHVELAPEPVVEPDPAPRPQITMDDVVAISSAITAAESTVIPPWAVQPIRNEMSEYVRRNVVAPWARR